MKKVLTILQISSALCLIAALMLLASCKKNEATPQANDLSPDSAAGNNVLTLTGSGLGDMRSIVFDNHNVPAPFNPNFNTDGAVIFRVPDTAYGGQQNIIFTNASGKTLTIPFKVIALATISSASIYEFSTGTQITLTGNNLETVSSVILHGTINSATVISKTRQTMVIQMPATSALRVRLDITNASGTITTLQEFVSVDNAFQFFVDDFGTSGGGIQNWSWCGTAVSSANSILGTKSLAATYAANAWAGLSFYSPNNIVCSDYVYMTMWIKGGTADAQVNIFADGVVSGSGSTKTITVPANVWTYFKLPIIGWVGGVTCHRFDYQMQGPTGGDQVIYYDDVLLVK